MQIIFAPYICLMEKREWFATWFDSKYYHILYQHRDHQEAEMFIQNIVETLQIPQDAKVLDLACGKGRHAIMLNKMGFDTIGLDLSPASIESARKYENDQLHFDTHDMREVYKEEQFDYIFNLFTSFGYFESQEDNMQMLQSVRKMLKPGGKVIIDFMNVNKVIQNLVSEEIKSLSGIDFKINRSFDGIHIKKNIHFVAEDQDYAFTEKVQALTKADFEKLISATKLQIINIFGDYKLQPYDEATSKRLIIVATKQ